MSFQEIKKFEKALRDDPELAKRVKEELQANKPKKEEDLAPIMSKCAEKEGFSFSEDDFRRYQIENKELDDAELEQVAGGMVIVNCDYDTLCWGDFSCYFSYWYEGWCNPGWDTVKRLRHYRNCEGTYGIEDD